jgi:hypothetical protein
MLRPCLYSFPRILMHVVSLISLLLLLLYPQSLQFFIKDMMTISPKVQLFCNQHPCFSFNVHFFVSQRSFFSFDVHFFVSQRSFFSFDGDVVWLLLVTKETPLNS